MVLLDESIIEQLNNSFNNNVKDLINILKEITINKKDLDELIFDDPNEDYKKYKLYNNDNYEIIIIKWFKNHETPVHQHPKNGCLLKVLYGKLTEHQYIFDTKYIKKLGEAYLTKNDISYIDDDICCHKIECIKNAYSLHIYSPPGFYD